MAIWFVMLAVMLLSFIVQRVLNSRFDKYSQMPSPHGMTGADVARMMLAQNGINDVQVQSVDGRLTDHYDPRTKVVNLSEGVYGSASIAACAVAAHETGHAIQHATGYAPLRLRSALVPVVTFANNTVQWVLLAGVILIDIFPSLIWAGIALFAVTTFFSLVTLPVEINASQRRDLAGGRRRGGCRHPSDGGGRPQVGGLHLHHRSARLPGHAVLLHFPGKQPPLDMDSTRIDKYLWAIRVFKTRSDATDACNGNKVKVAGVNAKPSKAVKAGDVLEIRKGSALFTYRVLKVTESRMGAQLVPEFAEDLTPDSERAKLHAPKETVVLQRDRGAGRPTKRDRRQLEEMMDSLDFDN